MTATQAMEDVGRANIARTSTRANVCQGVVVYSLALCDCQRGAVPAAWCTTKFTWICVCGTGIALVSVPERAASRRRLCGRPGGWVSQFLAADYFWPGACVQHRVFIENYVLLVQGVGGLLNLRIVALMSPPLLSPVGFRSSRLLRWPHAEL
jgi:hypothetical protein